MTQARFYQDDRVGLETLLKEYYLENSKQNGNKNSNPFQDTK